MPWEDVTLSEERWRFLQEHRLGYYSVSDLAERFSISRHAATGGFAARGSSATLASTSSPAGARSTWPEECQRCPDTDL